MLRPQSVLATELRLSPNHGERRGTAAPNCLILHYTGMATAAQALDWLCNPQSQVSCHYFVWEDGRIVQVAPEERRAWHAGQSYWQGETDLNSASIGVEIANSGHEGGLPPFSPIQIDAVIGLCRDLCRRHAFAPERVLAHSDIAPARKRDPGEVFPWDALHRAGVGHWVEPQSGLGEDAYTRGAVGEGVQAFQSMLARYGYEVAATGAFDERTEQAARAFQRHFRTARVDGIADASTRATLRKLIETLGPSASV